MTLGELAVWLAKHKVELKVLHYDDVFMVNLTWRRETITKIGADLTETLEEAIQNMTKRLG